MFDKRRARGAYRAGAIKAVEDRVGVLVQARREDHHLEERRHLREKEEESETRGVGKRKRKRQRRERR
jgi:hypothetical protein